MPRINLIVELRLTAKETLLTRVLRTLFEHSAFGPAFIECVTGQAGATEIEAADEVVVKGFGRIDLLVSYRADERRRCLVLEHKVEAGEGEHQTERYVEAADAIHSHVSQRRKWDVCERPVYVMLALSQWARPRHALFAFVQHRALIPLLEDVATTSPDPGIQCLAGGWAEELTRYYTPAPDFWTAVASETPGGLSLGFSVLESLANDVARRVSPPLEVTEVYRGAGSGRSWLAAKLARPTWRVQSGPVVADVHFQISLDPDERSASISLNHEVYPYDTRADAERLHGSALETYLDRRRRFVAAVRAALEAHDWRLRGEWNLVARPRVPSIAEERDQLVGNLAQVLQDAAATVEAGLSAV